MRKVYLFLLISILFTGCISISSPFKSNTFIVKEGYLTLSRINSNISKQMPISEKVGKNEIKIVNTNIYSSQNRHSLIVETEFIFKSFEIPEGLPAVARFSASLEYKPNTQEFKLANIHIQKIKFLKEELVEYINPQQKNFIPDTLTVKLYGLILHKSKKRLRTIKSYEIKNGKIKIEFN